MSEWSELYAAALFIEQKRLKNLAELAKGLFGK
jgi:hypothetical protein